MAFLKKCELWSLRLYFQKTAEFINPDECRPFWACVFGTCFTFFCMSSSKLKDLNLLLYLLNSCSVPGTLCVCVYINVYLNEYM